MIRAIVASRKVTIAAVRGVCLGGGAELAAVCDMVYTARDATWGFPEIKLGCYPPVAAVALPALVGQKRAAELILTGRQFSGDEAVAIGLANSFRSRRRTRDLVQETLVRTQPTEPRRARSTPRKRCTRGTRSTSTKAWLAPRRFISKNSSRPRTRARVSLLSSINDHRNGQANRKRPTCSNVLDPKHEASILRSPDVPHALMGRGRLPRLRLLRVGFF